MKFPPEAPWVTEMRDHFNRHGFYRHEDLERLLGKPGDSVRITVNGAVVYSHAIAIEAAEPLRREAGSTRKGESAGLEEASPNTSTQGVNRHG